MNFHKKSDFKILPLPRLNCFARVI